MKYLTTTFAVACMAFGFASITATPAQANGGTIADAWECEQAGNQWSPSSNNNQGACLEPHQRYEDRHHRNLNRAEINDLDSLHQVAINDDDRSECDALKENSDGMKLCVVNDENGNERVAGIEVPDGMEFGFIQDPNWQKNDCWRHPNAPQCQEKAGEADGEQFAGGQPDYWEWCKENIDECTKENFGASKTESGTFYPLPMVTVAEMDKLLAPGGTSVASFDKILAPGGTAVESDYQFADREDGSGGDFGESGGDFGEGDRAAASTAAE